MKFDHLKTSISNNAGQTPSLYMAMCMVESLFTDMEIACGAELSQCPAGDERLSTKLVWLSRVIGEIYRDQDAQLQRNRARLDASMEKLSHTRKALEDLADAEKKLEILRNEHAKLDSRIRQTEAAAQECEILTAQCAEARSRLEILEAFDPSAAAAELATLTASVQALAQEKAQLTAQLAAAKEQAQALGQETDSLKAETDQARQRVAEVSQQLHQARYSDAEVRHQLARCEEACAALDAEKARLAQEKEEKDTQLQAMQAYLVSFREDSLLPAQVKLENAQQDVEALEKSLQDTRKEYDGITEQRNALILDIARQKEANENQGESLKSAQAKLDNLKREKEALDDAVKDALSRLEALQNEVEQLKQKKQPELEALLQQEQQRRQELTEGITDAQTRSDTVKAEIKALEERLPKLEEDLKNDRAIYDALTASCASSSKELESLERQIGELRSNNDREKLEIYRKQLEENQQALEAVQAECARVQEEDLQIVAQLEAGQNERARLLELKRKHESGNDATLKQLRELEFVATKDYARETAAIIGRLELLETVRGKLSASVGKVRHALGNSPVEETVSLEDQVKTQLRELKLCADDLRQALVSCADSFKMEER